MELIDDEVSRSLTRTGSESSGARRLAGPARVPALQAPLYTPEQPPRIAGPSGNLPAQQVPWYTPEQPPRLAAPAESPAPGPIARAAGRLAGGAAGLLAGGAAATEAATGTVAANPDYFKTSIGDDGLAANIMSAAQSPQRIADVAKGQPTTARSQSGALNVPVIAQMGRGASGDWAAMSDAGAGRGSVNPPNVQPSPIAALASAPRYDDTYRADNLRNNQNQAYREGDPIGQIIAQRLGPQDGAQEQAPRYLAAQIGGIIGGGDTTYSPGMAPRTSPFQTADGRKIDPNDANLSQADSALISQYKAQNAQALADIERQQRTNPLAGAVQIIRPGNDVSYAVQGRDRMIEIGGDDFDAYQSALARNPQMGSQMQMTEGGMRIGGLLAPPDLADAGPEALQKFAQAKQQSVQNAADPLAADTAAKIAVEEAKGKNALAVAQAQNQAGKVPPGYRMAADGQSMEKIPGGPADLGKALPSPAVKELSGAGEAVEATRRMVNSFKPEFGGKTITGGLSNTVGRIMGDDTGQTQWWQDMEMRQNLARNALFGASQTKGELEAWEKTSVNPRMDPKEITKNLQLRAEIEARAASKLARGYAAAGYNKEQIGELLGTGAEFLEKPAPAVEKQAGAAPSRSQGATRPTPADQARVEDVAGKTAAVGKAAAKTGDPANYSPKAGTVEGGYRFKGGNPADPRAWEKA